MELKQLKELMSAMERTGTKRVVIKREGVEVEVERDVQTTAVCEEVLPGNEASLFQQEAAQHRARSTFLRHETPPTLSNEENGSKPTLTKSTDLFVTSPMVGTFYTKPAPDEAPFVKMGAVITDQSVVCIIEAMKVMNEIKARVSGTIAETLVKEGEPVEFGTKLFRITPSS